MGFRWYHTDFQPGDQKSKDEAFGLIAGPNTPEGRRICVFGVGVSLPAAAQDHLANYWCGIAAGTDGGSELLFWGKKPNLFGVCQRFFPCKRLFRIYFLNLT